MNRFFVSPNNIQKENKKIIIDGEDVKHISKVLRLVKGDLVEVCDNEEYQYIAEICNIKKTEVTLTIKEQQHINTEAPIDVILYQSIPKSNKMDLIIQKTTEIGIKKIVPILSNRTVIQLKDTKDIEKKIDRWEKIAIESSKQSKRGIIPTISFPITFQQALKEGSQNDFNLIAYEKEYVNGIKDVIAFMRKSQSKRIGIWIGPEGGFTEEEILAAKDNNLETITLGPRILRTETAGFALLSILMYELGDLGG